MAALEARNLAQALPPAETDEGGQSLDLGSGVRLCIDAGLDDHELPIFLRPGFLQTTHRPDETQRNYQLVDAKGRVLAAHALSLGAHRAHAPDRGYFGGPYFQPGLELELCQRFLQAVHDDLSGLADIDIVQTRLPPTGLEPVDQTGASFLLHRFGYIVQYRELCHARRLDADEFIARYNRGQRKNYHRCVRAQLQAGQVSTELRGRAHELLNAAAALRGRKFPLRARAEGVEALEQAFPGTQPYFAVFSGARLIAAASCCLITPQLLHIRDWACEPAWHSPAPLGFLCQAIARWARARKVEWLDLGLSSHDGQPAYGLVRFKASLGFRGYERSEVLYTRAPESLGW